MEQNFVIYPGTFIYHLHCWAFTIATSDWQKVYWNKGCRLILTFEIATGVWIIAFFVTVVNVMWFRWHGVYLRFSLSLQFWLHWLLFLWAFLGLAALKTLRRWWHRVVIPGHRLFDFKVLYQGDCFPDFVYNGSRFSVVLQGLWTLLRPSFFLLQQFFCGLSVIGALRHDDTVLQAFWITRPCNLLLHNRSAYQRGCQLSIVGVGGFGGAVYLGGSLSRLRLSRNWSS